MIDIGKLPNKIVKEGDWRMSIYAEPWSDSIIIHAAHYVNGRPYNVTIENGNMKETEMQEGASINEPFLRLPLRIYDTFATLFNKAEEPVSLDVTKAQLEAIKYHLEDMRSLVFKDGETK